MINSPFDRVDRWSDWAAQRLFHVSVYGGLPALVVLVTLDVILRYVFDSPLHWGRNVNGLLLLISTFSALPHAWDRGYHIRMELLYGRMRGTSRGWADIVAAVSGIGVLGLLMVQAWRFVPYMARTGETGEELLIPVWPFMAAMGICAMVFVGRMLANPGGKATLTREGDEMWR